MVVALISLRIFPGFLSVVLKPIGVAGSVVCTFSTGTVRVPPKRVFPLLLGLKVYANNLNIPSPLFMGDVAVSSSYDNMRFTPMLSSPMPLNLKELDSQCNGGMLIDSDTTYTHLLEPFCSQLLSMLHTAITYP
ncbi:hypothetical protein V6N13_063087 [Hibiscus sabdariffa]|uniref:Uncharacterized protein n=1 Tax=Hibiscus sabdariffa TaxID=183260 RepID=A0ABR2C4T6_9ROSI